MILNHGTEVFASTLFRHFTKALPVFVQEPGIPTFLP